VTEFLPADVVTQAPHSGYVITIDLAPAPHPLTVNPSGEAVQAEPFRVNPVTPPPSGPLHARRSLGEGGQATLQNTGKRCHCMAALPRPPHLVAPASCRRGCTRGTRKIAGGSRRHAERVDPF